MSVMIVNLSNKKYKYKTSSVEKKIWQKQVPGDPEELVELNELDELEGLVVVEVYRLHTDPQVGRLRFHYPWYVVSISQGFSFYYLTFLCPILKITGANFVEFTKFSTVVLGNANVGIR